MRYFSAQFVLDNAITWAAFPPGDTGAPEGVTLTFGVPTERWPTEALRYLDRQLRLVGIGWLRPIKSVTGDWLIVADQLKEELDELADLDWLNGKVIVRPEYEFPSQDLIHTSVPPTSHIRIVIAKAEVMQLPILIDFPELHPALLRFAADNPDGMKCAFLIMSFADTPLHAAITKAIREVCRANGIKALRADDKTYADDLLPNIQTYMHGCGFGIAVHERIRKEDFNPNIALEVGYMLALKKPICILKDETIPALQADLSGRLYVPFDVQEATTSVPKALSKWLIDKSLINSQH